MDMKYPPPIDPANETRKITAFIKKTFKEARKTNAVIAVSGGVDSTTSLFLTTKALGPQNITCLFLPAKTTAPIHWEHILRSCKNARIPQEKILTIPIGGIIQKSWNRIKLSSQIDENEGDKFSKNNEAARETNFRASHRPGKQPGSTDNRDTITEMNLLRPRKFPLRERQTFSAAKQIAATRGQTVAKFTPDRRNINRQIASLNRLRLANIAARTRMVVIFDQAKLHDALVVGTENQSEHLLGYFTRFGDEASDVEPIRHLYKIQVRELAKFLEVPREIIDKPPTAGLWIGQTDEAELGFSYEDADPILFLHYEQQKPPKEIIKLLTESTQRNTKEDEKLVKKVLRYCEQMSFKHNLPYMLSRS